MTNSTIAVNYLILSGKQLYFTFELIIMTKRTGGNSNSNNTPKLLLVGCLILIIIGVVFMLNHSHDSNASNADERQHVSLNENKTEQSSDPHHFPGLEYVELPAKLTSQIKEYAGFTISFNKDNGTPNYVAWELLGAETQGAKGRSNNFWSDPDIDGCPSTSDYTRSGYDRGHMCPSGEQKWSEEAMNDCFVMANICPQVHDLNNGAWKTLETKERQWAERDSAIMIVAGPIYEKADKERIGKAKVRVPGAFFKVIAAPYADSPRGIAFVYPNMKAPGNMSDYAMSIDELEKILGYDFFPALPDEIENKVESSYSFKEWNSSK